MKDGENSFAVKTVLHLNSDLATLQVENVLHFLLLKVAQIHKFLRLIIILKNYKTNIHRILILNSYRNVEDFLCEFSTQTKLAYHSYVNKKIHEENLKKYVIDFTGRIESGNVKVEIENGADFVGIALSCFTQSRSILLAAHSAIGTIIKTMLQEII